MKKILIVDDEQDIVEILTECIHHLGHHPISALNGEDGLQKAISEKPDLIISDINMPKMDGIEMIQKLQEHHQDIPVILFTAYADSEKIKKAWKFQNYQHVEKPIDLNLLQDIIQKTLNESR